jgi:hypothetical protein
MTGPDEILPPARPPATGQLTKLNPAAMDRALREAYRLLAEFPVIEVDQHQAARSGDRVMLAYAHAIQDHIPAVKAWLKNHGDFE